MGGARTVWRLLLQRNQQNLGNHPLFYHPACFPKLGSSDLSHLQHAHLDFRDQATVLHDGSPMLTSGSRGHFWEADQLCQERNFARGKGTSEGSVAEVVGSKEQAKVKSPFDVEGNGKGFQ